MQCWGGGGLADAGWLGQIANHLDDLGSLERALDLFHAMLENPTLFIEPYVRSSLSSDTYNV